MLKKIIKVIVVSQIIILCCAIGHNRAIAQITKAAKNYVADINYWNAVMPSIQACDSQYNALLPQNQAAATTLSQYVQNHIADAQYYNAIYPCIEQVDQEYQASLVQQNGVVVINSDTNQLVNGS